jgi:hypothetical protein
VRFVYAALWRRLPGGLPGKITGMLVLLAGVLALLFFVVFPWVEPRLPWNEVTVDTPGTSAVVSPSPSISPSISPGASPSSVSPSSAK